MIAIYRLGATLPSPGVSFSNVQKCIDFAKQGDNGVFTLLNLFSGGALLQLSVFALGIMPYITSSIILQLLTVVIPRLETLKKEGQAGQAKITQYTRFLAVGLVIMAAVIFIEQAQRRIPVQYAKRMVGRRMFGGTSTYIPLKVNQAGVIPVIFASSLLYIPQLASSLL